MAESAQVRIALILCSVLEREVALHGGGDPHVVVRRQLEMGLHDAPDLLRERLQAEIDALEAEESGAFDVIVLVYGLCGMGADGLRAGKHPLVIARAHDCFTHLLGSLSEYERRMAERPDCHFYSPGWNQARRVPGPERLELLKAEFSARFSPEDAEYLVETEAALWKARTQGVHIDLGTADAEAEAGYACRCCAWLGWSFERVRGDPALLRDLLHGPWDDARFQVVPPGATLRFTRDARIFKAVGNP